MKHRALFLLILAAGIVMVAGSYACCGKGGARFALEEEPAGVVMSLATEARAPFTEGVEVVRVDLEDVD
jgi:hypothetical protein